MLRRTAIKSIVLAALGAVGLRKKPELFVVETPDAQVREYPNYSYCTGYTTNKDEASAKIYPPSGHWKLHQIVFEKVDGCTK